MNSRLYLDLVRAELGGVYGYALSQELDEIIRYYELYDGTRRAESGESISAGPRTNWKYPSSYSLNFGRWNAGTGIFSNGTSGTGSFRKYGTKR